MLCADPSMDEDYDEMFGDLFDDAEVHLEVVDEESQEGGSDRFFFGCQGFKLRALCTGVCVSHFRFD